MHRDFAWNFLNTVSRLRFRFALVNATLTLLLTCFLVYSREHISSGNYYCTLHTAHCTLHTTHCTLHTEIFHSYFLLSSLCRINFVILPHPPEWNSFFCMFLCQIRVQCKT